MWTDITIALKNKLELIHLTTKPTSFNEISKVGLNKIFNNEIYEIIPKYDFKTVHAKLYNKIQTINMIKKFIEQLSIILKMSQKVTVFLIVNYDLSVSNIGWNICDDDKVLKYLKYHISAIDIAPTKYFEDISKTNEKDILKVKNGDK